MGGIGLWGEEFSIPPTQEVVKSIKAKTSSQLQQLKNKTDEQKIRSRIVDIHEKIRLIRENVNKKLGVYANNTVVIYNKEEFVDYIDKSIKNGAIAVDTETNNSLDPTTCKIMGLCIYTDGEKQAYIPINHVDPDTKEKLPNQLTEEDVKEQLLRLDNTKIIMHNAPFDYQVIGYTCDVWLHVDWDTMVASKILDENEEAKLKTQYITKIDPSIDKYDITSFFGNIEYALVPPDVFSLYAATDAFMTYKLYLYQKEMFELPENNRMYKLFIDVEMPIDIIASNMEKIGVCVDTDYANRLKESYNRRIAEVDRKIEKEVEKMSDAILEWRLTPEANFKPKKKKVTKDGNEFDKSKSEQLSCPVNVASNTQLAIIMYDVLKLPVVDKDKPRGTDSNILEELVKKNNFVLGDLILEKRGLYKLLSTYIDAIPNQISPRDGRLHAHFNSVGASTGRFSSSSPNL